MLAFCGSGRIYLFPYNLYVAVRGQLQQFLSFHQEVLGSELQAVSLGMYLYPLSHLTSLGVPQTLPKDFVAIVYLVFVLLFRQDLTYTVLNEQGRPLICPSFPPLPPQHWGYRRVSLTSALPGALEVIWSVLLGKCSVNSVDRCCTKQSRYKENKSVQVFNL